MTFEREGFRASNRPELRAVNPPPSLVGVPRLSRAHVERPRLTAVLDEDWPVVVVHAPIGYGKTALLAEWMRGAPHHDVAWFSLSGVRETGEPLLDRLIAVLRRRGMNGAAGSGDGGRATALRLIEESARPLDLVIDASESAIGADAELDLLYLLQHSDRLRLRLATRSSTRFGTLSTSIALDTRVLWTRELAFTPEETRELAAHLGITVAETRIDWLHAVTSGWPYAVRAAMQGRDPRASDDRDAWHSAEPFEDGITFVENRLLDEVMSIPRFRALVSLAGLETFTLEHARTLGPDVDAALLAEFESRGLGSWERDGAVPRFRLHPLLRTAMLSRISKAERIEVERRVAQLLEHEDLGRAFLAAIASEDWALAARLARRDFARVGSLIDGNPRALAEVPRAVLRAEPILSLLAGLGNYIEGSIPQALRSFSLTVLAGEQLRTVRTAETGIDQLWTQGLTAIALRLLGRWELVPSALRTFRKMRERVDDPEGELENAADVFVAQAAVTEILLDQLDDAAITLADRASVGRRPDAPCHRRFSLDGLAALVAALSGDLTGAEESLAELRAAELPPTALQDHSAVPMHLAEAYLALESLDPARAAAALEPVAPHWPTIEIWPIVLHAVVLTEWSLHGPEAALRRLEAARAEKAARPAIGPAMEALLGSVHAELQIATGRLAAARTATTSRRRRSRYRLAIPAARALLIAGEPDHALALADRAARSPVADRVRLEALTIAASAALRSEEHDTARRRFRSAIELATRTGLRLALYAMPREDFLALAAFGEVPAELAEQVSRGPLGFPTPGDVVRITPREQVVLIELASGATLAEVARRLSVSTNTVKTQTRSISRKLSVSGRAELVSEARRRGLL